MSDHFSTGKFLLSLLSVVWMVLIQLTAVLQIILPDICFFVVYGLLEIGLIYIGIKVLIEKGLKYKMEEFRIDKFHIKPMWILTAVGLPLCVCVAAFLFIDGEVIWNELSGNQLVKTIIQTIFVIGIGAAVSEEFVFRGVLMTAVEKKWNTAAAVIVPSFIFGILHIVGAGFSFVDSVIVVAAGSLVGIYFSILTYLSGTIWFSVIAHAFWNMITTFVSIAELPSKNSLISYRLSSDHLYVTGGMFGIDASILSSVMYLIFTFLIAAYYDKKRK